MTETEPIRFLGGPAHGKLIDLPRGTRTWRYPMPQQPLVGERVVSGPALWPAATRTYDVESIALGSWGFTRRAAFPSGWGNLEKASAVATYLASLWDKAQADDLALRGAGT
jgi:hypothetical protein